MTDVESDSAAVQFARLDMAESAAELAAAVQAIAGLAAVAIPAYQDYVMRAKVVELINMAGVCKISVAEYYQARSTMPVNAATAGCTTQGTENAKAPIINNGLIEIQAAAGLAGQLTSAGTGTSVVFTPMCGTPATPVCVGAAITKWDCKLNSTVTSRFLPGECRI